VIGNLSSGKLDLRDTMFVPETYFRHLDAQRTPKKGDVLYSVTGSYGIAVLVETEDPFCFQRHIALLKPHPVIDGKYLSIALSTRLSFQQASQVATGIAQLTVPLSGLRMLRLPVPPTAEQKEIVRRVGALFALASAIENRVGAATARAQRIPQAILSKAFSGGLVPSEAELAWAEGREYEPASVVLERIRAEHTDSLTGGHRRRERLRSIPGGQPGRSEPHTRMRRQERTSRPRRS